MAYKITATLFGLEEAIRMCDNIGQNLMGRVGIIQLEEMQQAVVTARNLAPFTYLRDAIAIQTYSDEEVVGGLVDTPACREWEFGNRKINARPYWRPPVWEAFFRMRRRLRELMRRFIRVH